MKSLPAVLPCLFLSALALSGSSSWQAAEAQPAVAGVVAAEPAADWPQWGGTVYRNMVSGEKGLPDSFDIGLGGGARRNIRWSAPLGSQTFGTPIVANGKLYISTKGKGDDRKNPGAKAEEQGELLCLNEKTGALLWRFIDTKRIGTNGICTAPTVQGNRVYLYGSRVDLVCLDAEGLSNGNDGPFVDEGALYGTRAKGVPVPVKLTNTDADIIWSFSVKDVFGIVPHNAYAYAPLVYGDYVYATTGNSAKEHYDKPMTPEAPSLMAVEKSTGILAAVDNEKMGRAVLHGQWGTPCIGDINGRPTLLYPGGDGVIYAFDPEPVKQPSTKVGFFRRIWSFDPNHYLPGTNRYASFGAPVCYRNRVYSVLSEDWTRKTKQGVLVCINAALTGDITRAGLIWKNNDVGLSVATVSIADGLVYLTDLSGKVHCIDADTGRTVWSYESGAPIWQSTLLADGKLYVGNSRGGFVILKQGRELSVVFKANLRGAMVGACTAANGTLYFVSGGQIYAVATGN